MPSSKASWRSSSPFGVRVGPAGAGLNVLEPPAVIPPGLDASEPPPQIGGYRRNRLNWANVLVIVPARFWGTKPQAFAGRWGCSAGSSRMCRNLCCIQKTQSPSYGKTAFACVERAMGVEPTSVAWEATVLPMNYARIEMNFSTEPRNPSVH